MGHKTRHIGIDHDLHAGDRDVFVSQLEVLLDRFWGRDGWHLQVKRENAAGVHLLRVFDRPVPTDEVVESIKAILRELDAARPDLAADARSAGMKSFASMEVKPTQTTALRLPLAPGRVMLLDRPLEMVTYRRRQEQDVVSYVHWIEKALRGEAESMPKEEVLRYVRSRLIPTVGEEEGSTPIIVPPQIEPSVKEVQDKSPDSLGSHSTLSSRRMGMKGRSWRLITDAWSGQMEADSLNHWVRQLSLYTPFRFSSEAEAVETVERFIDELPDHSVSDRLSSGQWAKVSAVIRRDVWLAFSGWPDQPDPTASARKLEAVWARWKATGRDLYDKSTWGAETVETLEQAALAPDFEWDDGMVEQLRPLSLQLAADLGQTAAAVKHLVRLIRVHPEVPRTWLVPLLEQHGIKARSKKLDKPRRLIDTLVEIGWVYRAAKHNVGRCRKFGLGEPVRRNFPPLDAGDVWWDTPRSLRDEADEEMFELEARLSAVAVCGGY
jgi:hypothetical protein